MENATMSSNFSASPISKSPGAGETRAVGTADVSADLAALIIGITITMFTTLGLLLNIVVLVAMRRCGLLAREGNDNDSEHSNTVFLLAAVAMFDCIVRHCITCCYFGPSILLQQRLGGYAVCLHVTQLLIISWAVGSITEMLIALNRLLVITGAFGNVWACHVAATFFTRRNCLLYAAGIYPAQYCVHYGLLAFTPCCKPLFSYRYFSVLLNEGMIIGSTPNIFFDYIFRPVAAVSTIIPVICYVKIFLVILRHSRARIVQHLNVAVRARRRKEAYRCLQFALAYLFYFGLWLASELQVYLPRTSPVWFSLLTYVALVDISTTALIQATMNSTVRGELVRMYRLLANKAINRVSPSQTMGGPAGAGPALRSGI